MGSFFSNGPPAARPPTCAGTGKATRHASHFLLTFPLCAPPFGDPRGSGQRKERQQTSEKDKIKRERDPPGNVPVASTYIANYPHRNIFLFFFWENPSLGCFFFFKVGGWTGLPQGAGSGVPAVVLFFRWQSLARAVLCLNPDACLFATLAFLCWLSPSNVAGPTRRTKKKKKRPKKRKKKKKRFSDPLAQRSLFMSQSSSMEPTFFAPSLSPSAIHLAEETQF